MDLPFKFVAPVADIEWGILLRRCWVGWPRQYDNRTGPIRGCLQWRRPMALFWNEGCRVKRGMAISAILVHRLSRSRGEVRHRSINP
jgi:hypothetical protein